MAENKVSYKIPTGKGTYVLSFRHPVVKDANGYGKKVQRGTGTSEEKVAKNLAGQLQELLNDEKWHIKGLKEEALKKYESVVVDAFYDCMPDSIENNNALDSISIKTLEEGYPNTSLVGMSGAGKTTLLRKLIGTTTDVFPTTSNNRTTTCDMEIIRSAVSSYKLAVQFISRNELEADLMDNMYAAIEYVLTHQREDEIIDDIELLITILNHREMSTRLSYTLGLYEVESDDDDEEDDIISGDDLKDDFSLSEYKIDPVERDAWLSDIENRVKSIANRYKKAGISITDIESEIQDDDEVLGVIDDIITEVIKKFSILQGGKKIPAKAIWPDGWYFETEERETLIKTAKIFVSDNYKAWGKLLTPIVRAMRIEGPFIEDGKNCVEPMVITDGIGLGHSTNSTSIPTSVLKRCASADVIVFVDSAGNPMMANTKEALKSLIEFGYADRLIFAFSKMDQIDGNNYRNMGDKKRHVILTLQNYLMFLRKQKDTVLSETEVQSILTNCIYFSFLNKKDNSKMTRKGLQELSDATARVMKKHISTEDVHFEYEALKLYYYIKEATQEFRAIWAEKTGYSSITNKTEHWSRIRALARRLGVLGQENYCELQPLSDFVSIVQEKINMFINQPDNTKPAIASEEVTDELKRIIKRTIGRDFRGINQRRMWTEDRPLGGWRNAYNEMGTGSRKRRARIIENIFDEAAPYLSDIPNLTEEQSEYLSEIIQLVERVLNENGCKLLKFNY